MQVLKTERLKILSCIIAYYLCTLLACNKKAVIPDPVPAPPATPFLFAKGADISWLTEMEAAGKKFYDYIGNQKEGITLLKELGMNTVRLRVWVEPVNGWNNKADVVTKGLRAKSQGMRIMIDFHYSDTWADPGKQGKPAAWASKSVADLQLAIESHTSDVLNALKWQGVEPEWVQVGNETNDGMLWPEGRASTNMPNHAQFVNAGYDAVKAVFPNAKVIVHVSNGWDNALFRWNFDGLKNNGAKWDVIGISTYPGTDWANKNTQCLAN